MMPEWLFFLISGIIVFLFSGINPAIIMSKLIYGEDIREKGSGNPGFTNFKRVYGNRYAWFVFAGDICKALLPCIVFGILFADFYGIRQLGISYVGFCAMLGHSYPVWYGFKGGKGFLVGAAAIWMMDWRAGLIATCVFAIILFSIRYMSLASICAAISCPITLLIFGTESEPWVLICCTTASLFMVWRHKENIKRLRAGTESKFSLLGRGRA